MSGVSKINREDIINAALQIARESGMDNIQARTIAKKMNCSTQPIFYHFSNMDEIKKQVLEKAKEIHREYMLKTNEAIRQYREFGKNYLLFAQKEPQLFRMLFMNKSDLSLEDLLNIDGSYSEIANIIEKQTSLKGENIIKFHLRMWIYTHGLACFIVNNACNLTDQQIEGLLFDEYRALMLLEEENGNISKGFLENQLKNWIEKEKNKI